MHRKPAFAAFLAVLALDALPGAGSAATTNTRILSGPSGTIATDSATFAFVSPEDGGFECRLDEGAWSGCSSPATYSPLAEGPHSFEVRALNRPGHADPTPTVATFHFKKDSEPPETTIVAGPSGTIATDSAIFGFESSESDSTFQCRLDSAEESVWAPCASPQLYSGLTDGSHSFEVRATDKVGNTDATPATATFATDTTAPETTIAAAPSGGPPKPIAGETLNLEAQQGNVQLQCPGEDSSTPLVGFRQVPVGCLINTRSGVVDITASKGSSGELQNADFWGGVFVVTQPKGDNQELKLKLAGRRMCERRGFEKKPFARAGRSGRGGRKLWGSGKGNYSTSGSYGSATVRGTTWLVVDRCDASTLIKVAEGTVAVRDFVKDRSLTLAAGQQYVAKAPIPRLNPDALP
ncbi:MAG TPA: hypothetical protein VIT89_01850 [Solirubrobacterales bacterium]